MPSPHPPDHFRGWWEVTVTLEGSDWSPCEGLRTGQDARVISATSIKTGKRRIRPAALSRWYRLTGKVEYVMYSYVLRVVQNFRTSNWPLTDNKLTDLDRRSSWPEPEFRQGKGIPYPYWEVSFEIPS